MSRGRYFVTLYRGSESRAVEQGSHFEDEARADGFGDESPEKEKRAASRKVVKKAAKKKASR